MIDKWKKTVDSNKVFGAVPTDSSEAFVWLSRKEVFYQTNEVLPSK